MNVLLCSFFWVEVFPNLWWGLVVGIVIIWSLYIVSPLIKSYINSKTDILERHQAHERQMKEDAFEREKEWYELKKQEQIDELTQKVREYNELTKNINDDELTRKVREYNELTIHQKLLDKATGTEKEINDLKKAIEDMKKKYESLDGEIEQIIIKKKQ